MPRERLSMHKIKELLRLTYECGLSTRQVSNSLGIGHGSVHEYLSRARVAGIKWPLPDGTSEQQLEEMLFKQSRDGLRGKRPLPDWGAMDKELRRKGMTRRLLWEEYRIEHPTGIAYSEFCKCLSEFRQVLDPRMRQTHKAGEALYTDYAGMTVPYVDPGTGEVHQAQIFVAALGASSYTYAEPTASQSVPDWVSSHVRCFDFIHGVPELLVSDNLKSGVTSSCPYEPDIQRTYEEMARHYGSAVLPARVSAPRDKAIVEAAVQSVEERVLAPLRNRQFFSLNDIREAMLPLLEQLNARKMQGRGESRFELFKEIDAPALKPLPADRYEVGLWTSARVAVDYHINVDGRFYSVPYRLLKRQVDVRLSGAVVEIFYRGERVASHARVQRARHGSTLTEHMPESHRHYAGVTSQSVLSDLARVGKSAHDIGRELFASQIHAQQATKACLGILRLSKLHGEQALEEACGKALTIQAVSYKCVEAILKNGLHRAVDPGDAASAPPVEHANIRGPEYYRAERQQSQDDV